MTNDHTSNPDALFDVAALHEQLRAELQSFDKVNEEFRNRVLAGPGRDRTLRELADDAIKQSQTTSPFERHLLKDGVGDGRAIVKILKDIDFCTKKDSPSKHFSRATTDTPPVSKDHEFYERAHKTLYEWDNPGQQYKSFAEREEEQRLRKAPLLRPHL